MTATASILFGDPQDFGRIATTNSLSAGVIVEDSNYTISDAFLNLFRNHSNITTVAGFDDERNLQELQIRSAVSQVEGYIQKALMSKTYEDQFRLLYNTTILSEAPVQAILAINYVVGNDEPASVVGEIPVGGSMGNDTFDVTSKGELRFSPYFVQYLTDNIFTVSKFVVRYKAGYSNTSLEDLPPNIQMAILEVASALDWNRGAGDEGMARKTLISDKVVSLLKPYRQLRIA